MNTRFLVLVALIASPLAAQSVKITAPRRTVSAYDSIAGLSATFRDSAGKKITTPVTWTTHPASVLSVVAGAKATITGEGKGSGYIVASVRQGDKTYSDSLLITVTRPLAMTVVPFSASRTDSFTGQVGPADGVHLDAKHPCAYVAAWDKRHNLLVGAPIKSMTIQLDTDFPVSIPVLLKRKECPDTTVDPARIAP